VRWGGQGHSHSQSHNFIAPCQMELKIEKWAITFSECILKWVHDAGGSVWDYEGVPLETTGKWTMNSDRWRHVLAQHYLIISSGGQVIPGNSVMQPCNCLDFGHNPSCTNKNRCKFIGILIYTTYFTLQWDGIKWVALVMQTGNNIRKLLAYSCCIPCNLKGVYQFLTWYLN